MSEFFALEIRKTSPQEKTMLMIKRRYTLNNTMNESIYAISELEEKNKIFDFPLNKWVNIKIRVQGPNIYA